MKAVLIMIFSALTMYSGAQVIEVTGTVKTIDQKAVAGAYIIDQRGVKLDSTDANGGFNALVELGERFGIDANGYELKWTKVQEGKKNYKLTLDIKVQEFESIVITRRNSEEALDIKNVNIIHYQPLDSAILTLKKEKRKYFLGIDSIRQEGISFALDIDKPKELFFDCFQNAYVLNTDAAYQFVIVDSGLVILSEVPIQLFNQYIRPCVAKFDDRLVMEELRSLNQEYELTIYDKQKPKSIYHKRDEYGYQAAYEASVAVGKLVDPLDGDTLVDPVYLRRQERRDVYGRHDTAGEFAKARKIQNAEVASVESHVRNGGEEATVQNENAQRPQMKSPNDAYTVAGGGDWAQGMAAYIMFTQPIDIKSFQIANFVAVVDFDSNYVHILDHNGFPIKSSSFDVQSDVKNVLQDKANGNLYLYVRDKGNHKVFGLDAFSGQVTYLKNFGGMPHTEQAIIYDGYLYYKVLERDFYGINRVRLPNMEFFSETN